MAKIKLTPEMREILKDEYVAAKDSGELVTKFKGERKPFNLAFFTMMRNTFDEFALVSDPQMRGSLNLADVYLPHSERTEPKKGGVKKADLVKTLNGLMLEKVGAELASAMKLVIADIELVIAALASTPEVEEVEAE